MAPFVIANSFFTNPIGRQPQYQGPRLDDDREKAWSFLNTSKTSFIHETRTSLFVKNSVAEVIVVEMVGQTPDNRLIFLKKKYY